MGKLGRRPLDTEHSQESLESADESPGNVVPHETSEEIPEQWAYRIRKGPKGQYIWLHETNLLRNPVFLFLVWKIYSFIWLFIVALILIPSIVEHGSIKMLQNLALPLFLVWIFILALLAFSYFLYALMMGGKYSVLFKMNEKGISHTQLPKQFKKSQKIALVTALLGLASRNFTASGAGALAYGNASMRSDFKRVRFVKAYPKRYTIKLRSSDLMHNQIYTAPEDYDFVLDFIHKRTATAHFRAH